MQINRLFEIVYLLLEKNGLTARELAERFEVSTRTIYRDVETLSGAGIPIYMNKGKGGGISLLPDFVLNKTVLTEEEKRDILSSLQALRVVNPVNMGKKPNGSTEVSEQGAENSLDTAVHKLSSLFGSSNANWVEVDFSTWANAGKEKELFLMLKEAVLTHKVISFTYVNGKGEKTKRVVEPLKLVYKSNSWYLYSYCREKENYRFFKLHRMKELLCLEESFQRNIPMQILSDENVFQCEMITLKLKLAPQMAYRVYDEFEIYKELEDGSFITEFAIHKGEWVYHFISSFGESCEVLEPMEVREEVQKRLERTLKIYHK